MLSKELVINLVCGTHIVGRKCCGMPLVIELRHKRMFISGTTSSKRNENALKTNRALDDHQPIPTRATFKESNIWCLKIVDWQLETSLIVLKYYLGQAIRLKWPKLGANNSRFLHHTNAPCHTTLVLRDFFDINSTHIVLQPPYSSDLTLCDLKAQCGDAVLTRLRR